MKKSFIASLISLMACSVAFAAKGTADSLKLSLNGVAQATLTMQGLRKMKATTVDFINADGTKGETYKGVAFSDLVAASKIPFDQVVEAEFVAKNGYKYYVNKAAFARNVILSYERTDQKKFERFSSKEDMIIELGPYYLIWDYEGITEEEKPLYHSVYQVNEINFVTNSINFGVHETADRASVVTGYNTYKKYCLSCHAVNGVGGTLSNDLNKDNVIQKKGEDYVVKYALDPKSVNPNSKMLPLPSFKNREVMARSVVDFLKFLKDPSEEHKKHANDKKHVEMLKEMMREMNANNTH